MTLDLQQPALPLGDFQLDAFQRDDPRFLSEQLITYIGNKRSLLKPIESAVEDVQRELGRPLRVFDAFSGSGVVSRMFKMHASCLLVNDIEPYAAVLSRCYLADKEDVPWGRIRDTVKRYNSVVDEGSSIGGFIERLYSPNDDNDIQHGERVFYTRDNARRLDQYAQLIHEGDEDLRPFLLGPLLSAASVNANTAGVFKGFYKDKTTGIGRFGGSGEDALDRIKGQVRLNVPVISQFRSELSVHELDAARAADVIGPVDLAYFDPPYNQHPYGSNYFMLNLLVNYQEPEKISKVSGIPVDWQRSGYNIKKRSAPLVKDLVERTDATFLLISFNDEGYITPEEMTKILEAVGEVKEVKTQYNTYRGSRNLQNRSNYVTEHLYLVDKRK